MKPTLLLVVSALAAALPAEQAYSLAHLALRALPNAPDGYTPANVSCPAVRPSVRSASTLSTNETEWLRLRRNKTFDALKDFFGHVDVGSFNVSAYLDTLAHSNASELPTVGIAISGGGYRALLNGAGAIKAFDNRTENATASGRLGGLLQSATYVSGLSGGSWLVGSIFINNFSSITSLQTYKEAEVWQFGNSIFEGPYTGGVQAVDTVEYYKNIEDAVSGKSDAGFPTTITDYWGRALSYQLVNGSNGGLDYTWSSIALTTEFQQADMPMPLVVADGRNPGELVIGGNATVYEYNPWEFGTFDPTIYGFIPLEYLGSRFVAGTLPSNETCVRGYDNAGFIMGTSSSLFNQFLLNVNSTALPSALKAIFTDILQDIGEDDEDIALYGPNPFYLYSNETSPYANSTELDLVDGGEDGQNVPLHPLIQPERHVDVVFAVDSSADTTYYWPNGTSLVATYERSLNASGIGNGTAFPAIPDTNTFVNLGLNTRPTFFGCNSSNLTGPAPLIVYLPNYPYVTYSNVSTFEDSYNDSHRDAMILNGYDAVTLANASRDGNWTACVGCAVLARSFDRSNTSVPSICTDCFDRYCWNGTLNSSTPAPYEPTLLFPEATIKINSTKSSAATAAAAREVTFTASLVAASVVYFLTCTLL
ncbi:hypothetical protein ASPZODRAFT_134631 [Penicilliopsis zonata CBS 506.65]|uniref:Lysophospholipase n=1 Tax=Penicilliopsis zonata CBS 506.65 TaxID=1073090 RepID=A0A1L9SBI7_9EURO|nr:hypothetical protein ASPZODRAFT_134631 [Penicilliopsis zonata CBS 506.65]OJJ44550.1 hypothetical protein ASPZODRAFT_134631 [Penicilliopsis zonata CBS 506.65]